MKYSAALLALAAGVFALPQESGSSITSAPVASASLTPQVSCALSCDPADVTCQAACLGIARPNSSQAVETNECAAKCDQGDGSPSATEKYAKCQQDCFASLFPSTQTIAPFAPGAASSAGASAGASATGSSSGAASTGAAASGSPSGSGSPAATSSGAVSGSPSGSGASSSPTPGAAQANSAQIVGAGLVGLMAIFAL